MAGVESGLKCPRPKSQTRCLRLSAYPRLLCQDCSFVLTNFCHMHLPTNSMLASQTPYPPNVLCRDEKIAPNLLLFDKQPSGWIVWANVIWLVARRCSCTGNKLKGRGISAHRYYSLLKFWPRRAEPRRATVRILLVYK